jgi:hypothetical protein
MLFQSFCFSFLLWVFTCSMPYAVCRMPYAVCCMLSRNKSSLVMSKSKSKSCYDRRTIGQFVLVSGHHLGSVTNCCFSLKFSLGSCGFVIMGLHFWREGGSVIYSCWWASQAQPLSYPRSMGLKIRFYYLKFEIQSFWRARIQCLFPPKRG